MNYFDHGRCDLLFLISDSWPLDYKKYLPYRTVARSEIPGGLVVLGGDNVSPLVEIGLADLPNIGGGLKPPQPPPCDGPVW